MPYYDEDKEKFADDFYRHYASMFKEKPEKSLHFFSVNMKVFSEYFGEKEAMLCFQYNTHNVMSDKADALYKVPAELKATFFCHSYAALKGYGFINEKGFVASDDDVDFLTELFVKNFKRIDIQELMKISSGIYKSQLKQNQEQIKDLLFHTVHLYLMMMHLIPKSISVTMLLILYPKENVLKDLHTIAMSVNFPILLEQHIFSARYKLPKGPKNKYQNMLGSFENVCLNESGKRARSLSELLPQKEQMDGSLTERKASPILPRLSLIDLNGAFKRYEPISDGDLVSEPSSSELFRLSN